MSQLRASGQQIFTLLHHAYQGALEASPQRHLGAKEVSDNNCVYRNEVHHTAGERTQVLQDVASDPTLPRTKTVRCNLCGHGEAVFFQAAARGEEGMTLFFVCCSPDCGHRWRE
ncbi:DNA-directed RNA polymerase subunit [Zea mays]|uniref:DNA-directed RNA polymerase subunit n=1 Tax=Zea mays TaxID=4577 RepID=A0A1D6EF90_MAIZE|nr:DNA-directed RNA polymerase subunit [Zea mays]